MQPAIVLRGNPTRPDPSGTTQGARPDQKELGREGRKEAGVDGEKERRRGKVGRGLEGVRAG